MLRDKITELARDVRNKGFRLEADLLVLAVDIAMAAVTRQSEVYKHSLLSLHNIACERLDELLPEPEPPKNAKPSRMN